MYAKFGGKDEIACNHCLAEVDPDIQFDYGKALL